MSLFFVTRLRWISLVIDSTNRNESNRGSYDVTINMATGLVGRWLRFGPSDELSMQCGVVDDHTHSRRQQVLIWQLCKVNVLPIFFLC